MQLQDASPPLRLVVDTDTAADDAVALVMAACSEAVIEAVTTVAGNVALPTAVRNALDVLALAGSAHVPVFPGATKPLLRALVTAEDVHGPGGLSGVRLLRSVREPESRTAAEALVNLARSNDRALTLVTLGPLTNIASAIALDPRLLSRFRSVVCMVGSSDSNGNITATAEYNAWADPEALAVVLAATADADVTLVGWDVSRDAAVIEPEDRLWLDSHGGPLGAFTNDVCAAIAHYAETATGLTGYDLADPIAMAVALNPSIAVASTPAHVQVALDPVLRGQLIVDRRRIAEPANVRLVTAADPGAFKRYLYDSITSRQVCYPAPSRQELAGDAGPSRR